jgi:hypothetical protein
MTTELKGVLLVHRTELEVRYMDIEAAVDFLGRESAEIINQHNRTAFGDWYCLRGSFQEISSCVLELNPDLLPLAGAMLNDGFWEERAKEGLEVPQYRCSCCKTLHHGYAAVSRSNNRSPVCTVCAVVQALAPWM